MTLTELGTHLTDIIGDNVPFVVGGVVALFAAIIPAQLGVGFLNRAAGAIRGLGRRK